MIERENDRLVMFDQLHLCPSWKRGGGFVVSDFDFDAVVHIFIGCGVSLLPSGHPRDDQLGNLVD